MVMTVDPSIHTRLIVGVAVARYDTTTFTLEHTVHASVPACHLADFRFAVTRAVLMILVVSQRRLKSSKQHG
jgi:hypothetical protein